MTWPRHTVVDGSAGRRPSPAPPSRHLTSPPRLPGCACGALGPPRSTWPLALCCSLGTSTAVSHDSDCRSPGRSSSPVVARSLRGGAGARAGAGSSGQLLGGSPTSGITPFSLSPPPSHPNPPICPPPDIPLWQPDRTPSNLPFLYSLNTSYLAPTPK